jgi:RNA polymerase sigma-70 factor (ECF subfamily)
VVKGRQRELVERAYRAYGHSVHRRACQILGDDQEAHDVAQEVFMALLDRPLRFEGRSELGTYLYAATTHACLNRLRNRRNRDRLREGRAGELEPSSGSSRPDVAAALRQVLAGLSEDEARAAVYHYMDGMSHGEIAEQLGCARRTVGDLLERMRSRLALVGRREAGGGS